MAKDVLDRLLDRHGRTFADEMGITLRDHPEPLFQLLVGSLLMSARISSDIAMSAARALFRRGYTTPSAMADASWQDRVDALGEGHYVRYDESTATYLGDTSELLLEEYDGDLREMRARADGDVDDLRSMLKACKGIGDVGASIFLREVQTVWSELYPFADDPPIAAAGDIGLPTDVDGLADLVGTGEFPRLLAALVRMERADDHDVVRGDVDEQRPTETQLETMTKSELYELAQEQDISGRSQMSKDELVGALREG